MATDRVERRIADPAGYPRVTGRRSAAVAATLLATIGIWAIALWAWLDGSSLTTPVRDPAPVGAHKPVASAAADRPAQAPSTPQPLPVITTGTARDPEPTPAQQLGPPDSKPADQVIQVRSAEEWPPARSLATDRNIRPPARTTAPEIATSVVRGSQPTPPPEAAPDGNTAVVRGKQTAETAQGAPDGAPTVVRGTRAPAGPSAP